MLSSLDDPIFARGDAKISWLVALKIGGITGGDPDPVIRAHDGQCQKMREAAEQRRARQIAGDSPTTLRKQRLKCD
jgi:hypothetical protein